MAGLGRRTHYRKHLTDSIIHDFPEPGDNECIAKVVATRGSNQFDIILPLTSGGATVSGSTTTTAASGATSLLAAIMNISWLFDLVVIHINGMVVSNHG